MPKEFKCPVHGYISIPEEYCSRFIDTPVFQRLRQIEQTGMRVLYPSAHHDRFIHSLGVFHLGQLAFHYLRKNSQEMLEELEIEDEVIESYKKSFLIACLLHDCGHSPFSHTFEDEYDINNKLNPMIKDLIGNGKFIQDYEGTPPCSPAPHEKVSVIVILKYYKQKIEECGADPILVARAVIGCKHILPTDSKERLENAIISLLNNKAIDVDKLDYIIRDTWASGVKNVSIDVERLLSSLVYAKDENGRFRLSFKKRALSVLQNVVEGRDYLYRWIYSHHKVVYHEALLKKSLKAAAELISPGNQDVFLEKLFSVDSILEPQQVNGLNMYLPTDGDIFYFLKKQMPHEIIENLLSRNHHKTLWKSHLEYERIFKSVPSGERETIRSQAVQVVGEYCESSQIIIEDVKPKIILDRNSIYISFENNECVLYSDVFDKNGGSGGLEMSKFYYIYGPARLLEHKDKIITKLKDAV